MTKTKLLMGASALVAASLAFASSAQAVTNIYGGGSSLAAGLVRQAADCYGNQVPLPSISSPLSAHTETAVTLPYFNFLGNPAHNCATAPVDATKTASYISAGSGAGINAYFSHDAATFWGDTVPGTTPSPYPSVQFGASDFGLSGTDANVYANGGVDGKVTVVAPGVTPVPPQYGNPAQLYGAEIQVPILISPVAFAYDPVYKKIADASGVVTSYKFKLKKINTDGSGGLVLDVPTLCKIFNGTLTNWNDPAIKALNGATSLRDPTDPVAEGTATTPGTWEYTGAGGGLPIEIVGRADGSGTTSIFYRAMAAQCTGVNNYAAAGGKTTPAALNGATYAGGDNNGPSGTYTQLGQAGKFTLASLSSGVSDYTAFRLNPPANTTYTQGRLAYLSPDYALPAVTFSGVNTYGLNVVDVKVGATAIEPTGANAVKAFGTAILPPQSAATAVAGNKAGYYNSGDTANGARNAPQDWAQPISTTFTFSNGSVPTVVLANPNSGGTSFYPFVGTTNASLYTCYNSAATTAAVVGYFNYFLNDKTISTATTGLLGKSGFSAMPAAWLSAITETFLKPVTTAKGTAAHPATDSLNLNIVTKATGPATGTGSQCHAVTVGA